MTSKERLIHTAATLIRQHGYFGTGITEILAQAEVPKGSLYHHFPKGKDQLIIAALEYSGTKMLDKYRDALRSKGAEEGLAAVVDVLIREMKNSDFQHGCPIATVALDIGSQNENIRKMCMEMYLCWQDGLAQYLNSRQISLPENKSKLFFSMVEGAFILAKAHKDLSYLELQKSFLHKLLET